MSVDPGPRPNCVTQNGKNQKKMIRSTDGSTDDAFCVRTRHAKSFVFASSADPVVIKIRWTLGGPDDPIDAKTVFMFKVS